MFKQLSTSQINSFTYRQLQEHLKPYKKYGYTEIKLNSKKEVLQKELIWLSGNVSATGKINKGCSVTALAKATRLTYATAFKLMKPFMHRKNIDGKFYWGSSTFPKILSAFNKYGLSLTPQFISQVKVKDFKSNIRGILFTHNHVMFNCPVAGLTNCNLSLNDTVTAFYAF